MNGYSGYSSTIAASDLVQLHFKFGFGDGIFLYILSTQLVSKLLNVPSRVYSGRHHLQIVRFQRGEISTDTARIPRHIIWARFGSFWWDLLAIWLRLNYS